MWPIPTKLVTRPTFIDADNYETVDTGDPNYVPGDTDEQVVLNAAKINILRLHDAKHNTTLDSERSIVCAKCHYSPAWIWPN